MGTDLFSYEQYQGLGGCLRVDSIRVAELTIHLSELITAEKIEGSGLNS